MGLCRGNGRLPYGWGLGWHWCGSHDRAWLRTWQSHLACDPAPWCQRSPLRWTGRPELCAVIVGTVASLSRFNVCRDAQKARWWHERLTSFHRCWLSTEGPVPSWLRVPSKPAGAAPRVMRREPRREPVICPTCALPLRKHDAIGVKDCQIADWKYQATALHRENKRLHAAQRIARLLAVLERDLSEAEREDLIRALVRQEHAS
jgi:hypothetical protein